MQVGANLADTRMPCAGIDGNPFHDITWHASERDILSDATISRPSNLPALSRQISAVPDLCCVVTRWLVESVGGVFDPVVSSAIAAFEHVKDESCSNSLFATSNLGRCMPGSTPL